MKRLTKAHLREVEGKCSDVQSAFSDLQDACEGYNDAKPEAKDDAKSVVETAISEYNDALGDLRSVCEGIAQEIREYIDGRSEKWQQSDKATAYEAWAEEWEADLEDVSWGTLATEKGNETTLDTSDVEDYNEVVSGYSTEVGE